MPEEYVYEITVTAKNASGDESTAHAEYRTTMPWPHEAAREIVDATSKQVGHDRMREVDPSR